MKKICERAITELIKIELTNFLGRQKYKRNLTKANNYRNGSYSRKYTVKNIGELKIKVARDRNGDFSSKILIKYDRYEKSIEKDLALLFLSGLSTRSIELISKTLIGRKISRSEVSNVNKELLTGIDMWRNRSLKEIKIKYMYMDGVNFEMRIGNEVILSPMLVVIGVTSENKKIFLAIQQGDKESASTW